MDGDVDADRDAGDDLDEAVHPLGRAEHEEDRGEELQEGGEGEQAQAAEAQQDCEEEIQGDSALFTTHTSTLFERRALTT